MKEIDNNVQNRIETGGISQVGKTTGTVPASKGITETQKPDYLQSGSMFPDADIPPGPQSPSIDDLTREELGGLAKLGSDRIFVALGNIEMKLSHLNRTSEKSEEIESGHKVVAEFLRRANIVRQAKNSTLRRGE